MKKLFTFLITLLTIQYTIGQQFETLKYFENDSIKLNLELFLPNGENRKPIPLVVFIHGGGFSGGKTNDGHNLGRHLVDKNIALASIEYTLYMKDKSFSCDGVTSEKIKAIQIAVSQTWHATSYLIEQADKYNFDTSKIFLAGNSAGAETAFHAAYWDRSQMQLFESVLDSSFSYVGIIAGAGAIMDLNLITAQNALPSFLFHGDKDPLVPYATAAHHFCQPNATGWLMLFGSKSIADHLTDLQVSNHLINFKEGSHRYHNFYFENDQQRISDFISRVINQETFFAMDTIDPDN